MNDLKGRIALVTGAGRGIGRAVSERLAQQGATVVLVARTAKDLAATAQAVSQAGGTACVETGDLRDERFIEGLFAIIRERFGRLDILVNNAGLAPFGPVETLPARQLREGLEVNVTAAFLCMQQAIRLMKATGGTGKIINIGSVRSHWTECGDAGAYNASKYALYGMTETVARELHGSGVNIAVSIVCPGVVDTPLTNPKGEPRPGWLRPETVAEAVAFVAAAPPDVNIFDLTLFPMTQKPW